jgi:hypothetical protein
MGLQNRRSRNLGILGLPLGSPETKWHLGVGPVAMHKVYYKGEGGGFPQVQAVVSLMSLCFPEDRPCTKCSSYALTNLLFGLCKFMWVIELFINLPSPHPGTPICPSTPEVLRTKKHAPLSFCCFHLWTCGESIKELGGASSIKVYQSIEQQDKCGSPKLILVNNQL